MTKMSEELKGVITQMLKPLKGLSLGTVIEGISGYSVLPFDDNNAQDIRCLEVLKNVANEVLIQVNQQGILRKRPNEVGNKIEDFVREALRKLVLLNYK